MIIILNEVDCNYHLSYGDSFSLIINEGSSSEVVLSETFSESVIINYAVTFVFADDNGRCLSSGIAGFFGNKNNLPKELKEAKRFSDLSVYHKSRFLETSIVRINKENNV